MRGLYDKWGEQIGYLRSGTLYTLEEEASGRLKGNFIMDLDDNPIWRIIGDAVYSLDGSETIGYFTEEKIEED